MKEIYTSPELLLIEMSADIDTVSTSPGEEKLPVVTDNNNFGGFVPLG